MPDFASFYHKGFILASTQSSGGKTFLNAVVLSALRTRGIPVQPFKVGPDYIDSGYASFYAGTPCYNLDSWLMNCDGLHVLAARRTEKAFGVVEGVMGLFDGISPVTGEGSSHDVATRLSWPVFLIVPAAKQGRSIRALVRGFCEEAGEGVIRGIILNKVGSSKHEQYLREALADFPVPVVGALPVLPEVAWPERHLGLQAVTEAALVDARRLAEIAEQYLDLDLMLQTATEISSPPVVPAVVSSCFSGKKIAVARDEAFHFYYPDNLDFLKAQGAELLFFSPLRDMSIPEEADAVFLGGGFPEVFAEQLSLNDALRQSFRKAHAESLPIYAECGGLMYLCETLETKEGQTYPMMGLVPGAVHMTGRLHHFGYSSCRLLEGSAHEPVHAHEFHYSYWDAEEQLANCWEVTKRNGNAVRREGYRSGKLIASYMHCYINHALPVWEFLLN
ncbi:MAG: cobyrinate a,c-diamide synthase [Opitutales bacterium]|nr:cobyrinate a,c-diamide synthase [Opitutales bacterium]